MKKLMTLALVSVFFASIIASCGGSRGGHCDAYGNVDTQEKNDVASVN